MYIQLFESYCHAEVAVKNPQFLNLESCDVIPIGPIGPLGECPVHSRPVHCMPFLIC
jgi:hypothetical protein